MRTKIILLFLLCAFLLSNNVYSQLDSVKINDSLKIAVIKNPIKIRKDPGFININFNKPFQYQFEANNINSKSLIWLLYGNTPNGIEIEQNTGLFKWITNPNAVITGQIILNSEYSVDVIVKNQDDPSDFDNLSIKFKFVSNDLEKPEFVRIKNVYNIRENEELKLLLSCKPSQHVNIITNLTPLQNGRFVDPSKNDNIFSWIPDFSFVSDNELNKTTLITFQAINDLKMVDTMSIVVSVQNCIDCQAITKQYNDLKVEISNYATRLGATYIKNDREYLKRNKFRTGLDVTSLMFTTAGGTFSMLPTQTQKLGGTVLVFLGAGCLGFKQFFPVKDLLKTINLVIYQCISNLDQALVGFNLNCTNNETSKNIENLRSILKNCKADIIKNNIIIIDIQAEELLKQQIENENYFKNKK